MTRVGTINMQQDGYAEGEIRTRTIKINVRLKPDYQGEIPVGAKKPSHVIEGVDSDGPYELGAAWAKKIENGNKRGQIYYSIEIDDPSFPQMLRVSAFESGKAAGEYDLVWSRPREQTSS